jgi:phosphonate transport system permease protein
MIDRLPLRPGGIGAPGRPRALPSRPSLLNAKSFWFLAFAIAIIWSLIEAGLFRGEVINEGGWGQVWSFVRAALHPDLSSDILSLAIPSTLITLAYAVCGTALSVAIGFVGGILSSSVWWQMVFPGKEGRGLRRHAYIVPWVGVRGLLAVPRAIHEVIWGLFFINILGLDPLSAVLAIAIPFGTITAKVYADILDETPRAPLQALYNSGVTPLRAFFYSLLPQAFPDLLSYAFYRLECAIRAAAILGLIGAGGLGFQILLSLQSLKYEQVWTFLYLLVLLNGIIDGWSSILHRRLQVNRHGDYRVGDVAGERRRNHSSDPFARFSLVVIALLVPFSFWYVGVDFSKLFAPRATRLLSGVVNDTFPPNLSAGLLSQLLELSLQTLSMSIIAIAIAGLGGLLLSYPAAANIALPGGIFADRSGPVRTAVGVLILLVSRGVLLLSRALSEGIWALLVLFVFFPGILPGAIALGFYNLGVLGRLMAETTENVDARPLRALKSQGATNAQLFLYGVLPQTLPKNLAYILYRWEVCVRATVVVGLVGAGGLGRLLGDHLASFSYRSVLTSLIFYVGLTFLVDMISAAVRRAVR